MGTVYFIAPEQTADYPRVRRAGGRLQLGCTLYYLLAGVPPSPTSPLPTAPTPTARCRPRPSSSSVLMCRAPWSSCSPMLAKRPEFRFQTAAEVAEALASVYRPSRHPAGPPGRSEHSGGWLLTREQPNEEWRRSHERRQQ